MVLPAWSASAERETLIAARPSVMAMLLSLHGSVIQAPSRLPHVAASGHDLAFYRGELRFRDLACRQHLLRALQ
jgi:hypothetical protein